MKLQKGTAGLWRALAEETFLVLLHLLKKSRYKRDAPLARG